MARPVALLVAVLVVGAILPATATAAPPQSTQLSVSTGDGDPCIDSVAFFTTHSNANPPLSRRVQCR